MIGDCTFNEMTFNRFEGSLTADSMNMNGIRVEIGGDAHINRLSMNNDNDYLLVNGDFYGGSYSGSLTAGTVELKGDFTTYYDYPYREADSHKTIFSGNKRQTIGGQSTQSTRFNTLILQNRSAEGVVFNNPVTVDFLFNHNNCRFTLYSNGEGSLFFDYDGDGLRDNIDPNPLDPEPPAVGDINLDGRVDIRDVTVIQRHLAATEQISGALLSLADTNGDGAVEIADATHLQKYIARFDVVLG